MLEEGFKHVVDDGCGTVAAAHSQTKRTFAKSVVPRIAAIFFEAEHIHVDWEIGQTDAHRET